MPAWPSSNHWSGDYYEDGYRRYVEWHAPLLRGRTEDCADLSLMLIIDFAEAEGLPLTFADNDSVAYRSSASEQAPTRVIGSLTWSNKAEYYAAVRRRVGASALFHKNTVVNPHGPAPGDLMLNASHAALVFAMYPPGVDHPRAADPSIPVFPGPEQAARQLNQTEYFRAATSDPSVLHVDYLNHRGAGTPVKQKAELIYYADAASMRGDGFEFRKYGASVLV